MNDPGSDAFMLLDIDLLHWGNINDYWGMLAPAAIITANGTLEYLPSLLVEIQIVDKNLQPWSGWIPEVAIISQAQLFTGRLTGFGIRNHLYFATSPGNADLAVASFHGAHFALLH